MPQRDRTTTCMPQEVPEATRSSLLRDIQREFRQQAPHLSMPELPHHPNELRIAWSPIMRNYFTSGNRETLLREIFQVNSIRVGRPIIQALKLFVTASDVAVSPENAQKNKIKSLIGLFMLVAFCSVPPLAPEKNERGLVIGGVLSPGQTLSRG